MDRILQSGTKAFGAAIQNALRSVSVSGLSVQKGRGQYKVIKNLVVSDNQKMEQVIDSFTDRENPKCSIEGRSRQYITAIFQYKQTYVGLLELENRSGSAASTWVISSKEPVRQELFDRFLHHYVDEDLRIIDIKKKYEKNTHFKFSTKNHARGESLNEEDLMKWMVGMLCKCL